MVGGRTSRARGSWLILDIQAKLEPLKCLDHLSELLQGKQLSINDEGDFAIGIGDPASHGSVGSLEVSGLSLLDVPCRKRFLDSSANSTECQIGTGRIELPEEESLPIFSCFFRLHAEPQAGVEVRDDKVPGLTAQSVNACRIGKSLSGSSRLFDSSGGRQRPLEGTIFSTFSKQGFTPTSDAPGQAGATPRFTARVLDRVAWSRAVAGCWYHVQRLCRFAAPDLAWMPEKSSPYASMPGRRVSRTRRCTLRSAF